MKISAVMPVHNECRYLLYSLPALKILEKEIDEFLFVLDRCTDESERYIRLMFPQAKVVNKREQKWKNPTAEAFQYGFDRASGDVMWALGADLIVDGKTPEIIRKQFQDSTLGTICFRYLNYDLFSFKLKIHGFYENLYRSIIQHVRKQVRHTGFYAFRKRMMSEIGGLRDVPSEYDEFMRRVRQSRWKSLYVPYTNTLHLRPGLTKRKQYIQGRARYYLPQYNLMKTIMHSLVHFKPYLIVGYLHERSRIRMR